MKRTKVIAEIGINFAYGNNKGDFLENAKRLIDVACVAGCDYVKFQKRTPEICVPEEQMKKPKNVPWKDETTTYIDYKFDIEFEGYEYDSINTYCKEKGIKWFASVWDKKSVDFMSKYQQPDGSIIMKIPSALITDIELCEYARSKSDVLIISTGMSTEAEVQDCIANCNPDVIMHTNSTYPAPNNELNLEYLTWLRTKYGQNHEYGYSGHEFGLTTTIASTLLGAEWIERHITLNRTLWGSDQMASVEPQGLIKLIKSIRDVESAMGGNGPRKVLGGELEKQKSLRK